MSDRLTKADWLACGLQALAEEGPDAIKIGSMASKLGVSRGSFYWHFRDVREYRGQLLQHWLEQTTERVIRRLNEGSAEPRQLRALLRGAFVTRPQLDPSSSPWAAEKAIRAWASKDPEVAVAVATVDDRRVGYIAELLTDAGTDGQTAADRAAFLYWAYLGQALVIDANHAAITTAAIDDIAALFEGPAKQ